LEAAQAEQSTTGTVTNRRSAPLLAKSLEELLLYPLPGGSRLSPAALPPWYGMWLARVVWKFGTPVVEVPANTLNFDGQFVGV
jgi:hypothetical protein